MSALLLVQGEGSQLGGDMTEKGSVADHQGGDGSAGDADYGLIGSDYSRYRQPEPFFVDAIHASLDAARTLVNVGAGAGSYEPGHLTVTAVEPSTAMRAQRPAGAAPVVNAVAEDLPFADRTFDAALASFTVHQWRDLRGGLREVRRVTRGPVVILTCDPTALGHSWINDYAPEVIATEARRYPTITDVQAGLGGTVTVQRLPIPWACVDGFSEAYYGRPEALLDPGARRANSAWSFVGQQTEDGFDRALRADLASGAWDDRYGHLRTQPTFDGSLRLVVGHR